MQKFKFWQPVDRAAMGLILVLICLIIGVIFAGDRAAPHVRDFNWQGKQIGADNNKFILTFSRPMNRESVETNLQIEPLLPGKFSWSGGRMAYTLLNPAPYGTTYKLQLQSARDKFSTSQSTNPTLQPFVGEFRSHDLAFAYIGVDGEEQGRLVLYNLTQNQKTILTPKKLIVIDFKPYPDSSKILFSAEDRLNFQQGTLEQQLYSVSTGIHYLPPKDPFDDSNLPDASTIRPIPAGNIDLVLDSQTHRNLKFDLSADGKTIVVQRVNKSNPADFGLWVIQPNLPPKPLENQPGGDFLITPDSASLAVSQGEGVGILPLQPNAEPLDFLPKFGMVLSFSKDNTAATMVNFNKDNPKLRYVRSLYLVTNQGEQNELFQTKGSINNCEFTPQKQVLYCLMSELIKEKDEFQEQPYLMSVDLTSFKAVKIVKLPMQRNIQMSLSADGLTLLFDQTITSNAPPAADSLRTNDGQAIATSRLWLLPLVPDATGKIKPELLPLPGFHPRWLP